MLEDLKPRRNRYRCNVVELGNSLDETDAKIFWDAISDSENWTAHGLHQALKERGLRLSDKAIKKHRWNECGCSVA